MARVCPNCHSTVLRKEGFKNLKDGRHQRYRCIKCGHLDWKMHYTGLRGKTTELVSNGDSAVIDEDDD